MFPRQLVPSGIPRLIFQQAFKNIDDALRKIVGSTTERDCAEQPLWRLFLN